MSERLPVNIFPGMLPSAFTFLDTMEDGSKWQVPIGGTNFTAATVGDIYGYYGKGIRFEVGQLAANGIYSQNRSLIASPAGNYIISANFKLSTEFLNGALATSPYLKLDFNLPTSVANELRNFWMRLSGRYSAVDSGALIFEVGTGASVQVITTNDLWFDGLNPPAIATFTPAWFRYTAFIVNNTIKAVKVNNTSYASSLVLLSATSVILTPTCTISIQKRRDGIAENIWADIDQISVSETENRV